MKILFTTVLASTVGCVCIMGNVYAQATGSNAKQTIGSTTSGIATTETHAIVVGWSAARGLLGKTIVNENGQWVGTVNDLIVTRDSNVPYLIIGAGGFVGIGRHDVAVPVSEVQEQNNRLVWSGATRDKVKSMPHIAYAKNTSLRDIYIANVELDIKKAQQVIADTQKKAAEATGEAKAKLEQQIAELKQALKATEEKAGQMKRAAVHRWKEFERDVDAALAKLRQAIDRAAGTIS
jgi:sporulation protein YlmC with PRC-barrel domain/ElaB/YqjD/DUF883 family membrane-anchored ribosome-binding protein